MPGPYDLWCSGKDCSARFTEVADLVHHRKVAHPEEIQIEYELPRNHPCTWPGCDRAFRTAADAALHLDSHGPLQCPRCPQTFEGSVSLTAHLGSHTEDTSTASDYGSSQKRKRKRLDLMTAATTTTLIDETSIVSSSSGSHDLRASPETDNATDEKDLTPAAWKAAHDEAVKDPFLKNLMDVRAQRDRTLEDYVRGLGVSSIWVKKIFLGLVKPEEFEAGYLCGALDLAWPEVYNGFKTYWESWGGWELEPVEGWPQNSPLTRGEH